MVVTLGACRRPSSMRCGLPRPGVAGLRLPVLAGAVQRLRHAVRCAVLPGPARVLARVDVGGGR